MGSHILRTVNTFQTLTELEVVVKFDILNIQLEVHFVQSWIGISRKQNGELAIHSVLSGNYTRELLIPSQHLSFVTYP